MIWIYLGLAGASAYFGWRAWKNRWRRRSDGASSGVLKPKDIEALACPSLWLVPSESGLSKLGGDPALSPAEQWPMGSYGPLAFLLELDLADARRAGSPAWLPAEGALHAFHGEDYGDPRLVRVIYTPPGERETARPPASLAPRLRYQERRMALTHTLSVPSLEWLEVDQVARGEDWHEIAAMTARPQGVKFLHKLGGYPEDIQPGHMPTMCEFEARGIPFTYKTVASPEIRRAAGSWRLLLQIDSDPTIGMKWGDGGMLYIFVREEDALAADFSRTITLFQSH